MAESYADFYEKVVVDPNDLANGYYKHLPKVSEKDLYDVLDWFEELGIPSEVGLFTGYGVDGVTGKRTPLPTQIKWEEGADGTKYMFLDAALVFNFPHVARVELLNFFGLAGGNVLVMYPGPRKQTQFVEFNPIGAWWPEQGSNAFRPAPGDTLPVGASYEDETGRYHKEKRQWAFISFAVWVQE